MSQGKTKVYIYTRVSTTMQIDGYSLDAQKARMKAYADFNDYQIVGEYEDAGKSGKSIEGRASFCRMMEDIKSGKDGVSYVLVFKLSRFGRNAADVLSTLQVMQDFGVNLICVEDGIDSSKDAGKLMISVLSAVAEIERENIRVQTMEGRIQKAREGRWNGGFAPYGYRLIDGVLQINEDAPNERKMAHPINLSLITVASTARCNVGRSAISTSRFKRKFWTMLWWRLSSNWSAIQSLPP